MIQTTTETAAAKTVVVVLLCLAAAISFVDVIVTVILVPEVMLTKQRIHFYDIELCCIGTFPSLSVSEHIARGGYSG